MNAASPKPTDALPTGRADPLLRRALARETLASVRLLAAILSVLIGFGLLLFLLAAYAPGATRPPLRDQFRGLAPAVLGILFAALAYEATVIALVTRWRRRGHEPGRFWPYLSSAIEISFPTAMMLALATRLDAHSALTAVSNAFYLVFILLAVLRLDFGLCAFTGLLAGVEYTAAALWVLRHARPGEESADLLSAPVHHVIVGLLFVACGLVAGFVSVRIQRRISASIRHAEDRNRVLNLFGQHVSPAVVERLLHQDVEAAGEIRHVCVMFLDIRDFSPYAEAHPPDEVIRYLNAVFGRMIDAVNDHGGIVHKFMGDGFVAVFGAPIEDDDRCRHALGASLAILQLLDEINRSKAVAPTRIGIGLHAGPVVAGNLGSASRKEYAIIGHVVNTAARIEQLNKQFASQLLVSDAVRAASGDLAAGAADLGDVPIRGQNAPLRLFKLA